MSDGEDYNGEGGSPSKRARKPSGRALEAEANAKAAVGRGAGSEDDFSPDESGDEGGGRAAKKRKGNNNRPADDTFDDAADGEDGGARNGAAAQNAASAAGANGDEDVGITAILLDIEGTTTPLSFVHDTLFPYAAQHVEQYLHKNASSEETQECIKLIREQAEKDIANSDDNFGAVRVPADGEPGVLEAVLENVRQGMKRDRKVTGLKQLQGSVWASGYQSGQLESAIYPDVKDALERWTAATLEVFIYSSGSISAQQLIFTHSDQGDLSSLMAGYYDTTSGPKTEAESYKEISRDAEVPVEQFLFLTDNVKEADAARAAGMSAALMDRPGNNPLAPEDKKRYRVFSNFEEIDYYIANEL